MWLYAAIGLVGLVIFLFGLMGVLGSRLAKTHVASTAVDIAATPAAVFALCSDPRTHPTWAQGVEQVRALEDRDGRPCFEWMMGRNRFITVTTALELPVMCEWTIDDNAKFFSGSWRYDLSTIPGGCRVTLTETGTIPGAIPRAIIHYVVGEDFNTRRNLAALKRRMESAS